MPFEGVFILNKRFLLVNQFLIASKKLLDTPDLSILIRKSAATLLNENGSHSISLNYLERECRVQSPDVLMSAVNGQSQIPSTFSCLICGLRIVLPSNHAV